MSKQLIKDLALHLDGANTEHEKAVKGNKAAATRFRKHLSQMKHLATKLRAESKTWPLPGKEEIVA